MAHTILLILMLFIIRITIVTNSHTTNIGQQTLNFLQDQTYTCGWLFVILILENRQH